MKKFFSFILALTAVCAVNAKQVVFDFTNPAAMGIVAPAAGSGTNITAPVVFEEITLSATDGSTATRIWNSGGNCELRVYKDGTITFTSTEEISAVEFDGSIAFTECDAATKIWLGSATSVTFTATATCNIKKAIIYIGETPEIKEPEEITVAKALETGKDLASGATTADAYAITGYVTAMINSADGGWATYGNQIFWIADENNGADSNDKGAFEIYQGVPENELFVGDKVRVVTKIKNYNGVLESETKVPVQLIEAGEGEKLDTLTAAQALARAQALEVDAQVKVVIIAYVASIKTPYDASYKNITVWLNDDPTSTYGDIQAFRAKVSETDGPTLAEHDQVQVVGFLTHSTYDSEGETKHSYQIAAGSILTVLAKAQGIENIVLTEKVQKVMVDGVLYIVRDNKLYDVRGTQVR